MNKSNEVPERSAIADESKWDLEAIYENFDAWQKAFNETQNKIEELKKLSWPLSKMMKLFRLNLINFMFTRT